MARVRFSDVHQLILEAFPGNTTSSVEVSRLLVSTFPSCEAKRDTKGKREMYYERIPPATSLTMPPSSDTTTLPLDTQLALERRKVQTKC